MLTTKLTLMYLVLSLFVFLSMLPWFVNLDLGLISIQIFLMYGSVVMAFLGGNIWAWTNTQDDKIASFVGVGFSLTGLAVLIAAHYLILIPALLLVALGLQALLLFEKSYSHFFKNNPEYAEARILITNLVTICCLICFAYITNPYS